MPNLAGDVGGVTGGIVQGSAERATDLAIPTASGFVLVVSLALPAGVISGSIVDLWNTFCGLSSVAATISYEVRQGASVMDKGYTTLNAGWACKLTSRRLIALVSGAAVDLYVATNSGTFSIRPATVSSEHARIGVAK